MAVLPQRSVGEPLRTPLPVPPGPMPLLRDRRPRKRWAYAGLFSQELMLCAATIEIGPVPQAFWAVLDRTSGRLADGTSFTAGPVRIGRPYEDGASLAVRGRNVTVEATLEPTGEPVEVVSPHGRSYIWTRKLPVRARGHVTVGGRRRPLEARGLVDASAGYHSRSTAWSWSCGVGEDTAGRELTWNVAAGVHDDGRGSERALWSDGTAAELPGALFDEGLTEVTFLGDPAVLRFSVEAERARRDNFGVLMSDYRQPFGSFSGSLPGAELAWGLGVMERHDVRW